MAIDNPCQICGRNSNDTHHLNGGRNRGLADYDGLTIRLCRDCHSAIHRSGLYEMKCKALGQELYELKQMVMYSLTEEEARAKFRSRYGKNYL